MDYDKFCEYIDSTPTLSDDYKKALLEDAKKYDKELLKQIIIIVYNSELSLIETSKKLKTENNVAIKEEIKQEESEEKRNAEKDIENLLDF